MKLVNKVLEYLDLYNGKANNHNAEAGDTSFDDGHWHKTMIDAKGNGKTVHVMPDSEDEEGGKFDHHVHEIVNWEVKEAEGHSHTIIS